MIANSRRLLIIALILIAFSHYAKGQDFTGNTLKIGLGPGVSMARNTDGLGFNFSIGYQREIWKDRLRFNPNLSIGHYSSKYVMDARDQYFGSYNLESNLFYDLLRANTSSLVVWSRRTGKQFQGPVRYRWKR